MMTINKNNKSILRKDLNSATRQSASMFADYCITAICLNGDSLSKYQKLIKKQYGTDFYQRCEDFVKEVQIVVDRKKFTKTSAIKLESLARGMGLSSKVFSNIKEKIETALTKPDTNPTKPDRYKFNHTVLLSIASVLLVVIGGVTLLFYQKYINNPRMGSPTEMSVVSSNNDEVIERSDIMRIEKIKINKIAKSNYGKDIAFQANLLSFPDISNNEILNYLYGDVFNCLENKKKVDFTAEDLHIILENFVNDYIKEHTNTEEDEFGIFGLSMKFDMELVFVNQHFLCVKVFEMQDIGTGVSMGVSENVSCKNVNYNTGEVVKLSDLVKNGVLTQELLYDCFKKYGRDGSGRAMNPRDFEAMEKLYYPEEFTFDKEAIHFFFPKHTMGGSVYGNITFKVPYWEIEEGLQPTFKKMIDDSQSIGVSQK